MLNFVLLLILHQESKVLHQTIKSAKLFDEGSFLKQVYKILALEMLNLPLFFDVVAVDPVQ